MSIEQRRREFESKGKEADFASRWDDSEKWRALGDDAVRRLPAVERQLAETKAEMERLNRPVNVKLAPPAEPKPTVKRPRLSECLLAAAASELKRQETQQTHRKSIEEAFPGDAGRLCRRWTADMLKSAVDPADTTSPSWASELVADRLGQFWRDVAPGSLMARVLPYSRVVSLRNVGSLTIPHREAGDEGSMSGDWIPEGQDIGISAGKTASTILHSHKTAVMSLFTEELKKVSVPDIQELIAEFVDRDMTAFIDSQLISDVAAVAGKNPAGLLQGIAPIASTDVDADLRALLGAIMPLRPRRAVWVMDEQTELALMMYRESGLHIYRDEMRGGTLLGKPYIASASLSGFLGLADLDSLYIAPGLPSIDTSAAAMVAGDTSTVSAFQQYVKVVRVVVEGLSWKWVRPNAIAHLAPAWSA